MAFLFLGSFGLFDLGLGRATTYRISSLPAGAKLEGASVLWTSICVNLSMGLVGAAVLWTAADYFFFHRFKAPADLKRELPVTLPLLAASLPVATMTNVLSGALQARDKFLQTNIVSITSTCFFQIFPLVVAATLGPQLPNLLAAALLARLIAIGALVFLAHREFSAGVRIRLKLSEVPLLLRFGGWVFVDSLLAPLLSSIDRFAIGAVLGAEKVTVFSVPYQLAQRITILPGALASALFPRLPTVTPEQRLRSGRHAILLIVAVLSPLVAAGLFAMHPFMLLWVGAGIGEPAADVGILILLGFWFNAVAWPPNVLLLGAGRPDLLTKLHLVQIPFYLAGLYVGLKEFGLIGAALAMAFRSAADLVMLSVAARQLSALKTVSAVAAVLIISTFASYFLPHALPVYWLIGAACVFSAIVLSWRALPSDLKIKGREYLSGLGPWRSRASSDQA